MEEQILTDSRKPVLLHYYVPFYFNDNLISEVNRAFAESVRELPNGGMWNRWRAAPFPVGDNPDIYGHILSMMNVRENGNSVCYSWEYRDSNHDSYLHIGPTGKETFFTIPSVYVHLFRTGIGFLGYQIAIDNQQMTCAKDLILFQNRIKELTKENQVYKPSQFYCTRIREDDPEDILEQLVREHTPEEKKDRVFARTNRKRGMHILYTKEPVHMDRIIADLLRGTYRGIHFFAPVGKGQTPDKALLFSYLCYDCPDRERLKEITTHMAMGYSERQKLSPTVLSSCHELSDNVSFFISQEGCAVSVCPSEENYKFFVMYPPVKVYNFIYFFTLYQHYSLLHYTMRIIRDLPSDNRIYLQDASLADSMQAIITDINTFLMKSDVATVSNIQYHNLFYAASRNALNIEADKQSLRSGFEYLVNIQKSMQLDQAEKQHQQEQAALDQRWMKQEADRMRQEKRWREQDRKHEREREIQNERDGRLDKFVNYIAIFTFIGESGNIVRLIRSIIDKIHTGPDVWDIVSAVSGAGIFALIILIMRARRRRRLETGEDPAVREEPDIG